MPAIDHHPTVLKVREKLAAAGQNATRPRLTTAQLLQLCLDCGADDAGIISIDRPELDDQRDDILKYAPWTKSLLSFVCKMNREPIRSTARSLANLEFHHVGDHVNTVARNVVTRLEQSHCRAVNPAMGFPMEMDRFPGKIWVVSHKPVAVAAGLGTMGIHRNVIHPKFGNFILLDTILLDHEVDNESQPIAYDPCLECKLCVAACPVGAISPDGAFDFNACYTHNYREFMGGFTDWTEQIAESRDRNDYRSKVTDAESASMWASLSEPTTRPLTAFRSVRLAKTSLLHGLRIARRLSTRRSDRCRPSRRTSMSSPDRTPPNTSRNGSPTRRDVLSAAASIPTRSRVS